MREKEKFPPPSVLNFKFQTPKGGEKGLAQEPSLAPSSLHLSAAVASPTPVLPPLLCYFQKLGRIALHAARRSIRRPSIPDQESGNITRSAPKRGSLIQPPFRRFRPSFELMWNPSSCRRGFSSSSSTLFSASVRCPPPSTSTVADVSRLSPLRGIAAFFAARGLPSRSFSGFWSLAYSPSALNLVVQYPRSPCALPALFSMRLVGLFPGFSNFPAGFRLLDDDWVCCCWLEGVSFWAGTQSPSLL